MKNNLKSALQTVYEQELAGYPDQRDLEQKYSFSKAFLMHMDDLIEYVSKTYIILLGYPFSRNALVLILAIAVIIPIGWLYLQGTIDRSQARLMLAVAEMILVSAFGVTIRSASRSLTRTYKNAFTDSDEEEITRGMQELVFFVPDAPEGFTKTSEYRTAVNHTVEYKDGMGRVINYSCINIRNGVLTKIDTANARTDRLDINGMEAMAFVNGQIANLVWADKNFRYYLQGDCTVETLTEMAKSIKQ